tara:strand:- start:149 stop:307 length:159 start_codon:yes stop_codon:yes gene_type:complete
MFRLKVSTTSFDGDGISTKYNTTSNSRIIITKKEVKYINFMYSSKNIKKRLI